MSAPRVPGNTRAERRAMLTRVGCPPDLLDQADDLLRVLVTPVRIGGQWKVPAWLSEVEARRVVRQVRAGRRWSA